MSESASTPGIAALAAEAAVCRLCPLWENATRTVFGEGPAQAPVLIVGEQPGDQEDLAGRPFVGPAGQMLDRALREAGVSRAALYVTNAVKHFKNEPRGKRRLHKTPTAREIDICKVWLEQEIAAVDPQLVVALGASALRALGGGAMTITKARSRIFPSRDGRRGLVTVHPSYLLRLPDEDMRVAEYARFVQDLMLIRQAVPEAAG